MESNINLPSALEPKRIKPNVDYLRNTGKKVPKESPTKKRKIEDHTKGVESIGTPSDLVSTSFTSVSTKPTVTLINTDELDDLRKKINELETEIVLLEAYPSKEVEELKKQITEANTNKFLCEKNINKLNDELSRATRNIQELTKKINTISLEKFFLQKQLLLKEKEKTDILSSSDKSNFETTQKIKNLTTENNELNNKLSQATEKIGELTTEQENLNNQIREARQKIEELTTENKKFQDNITQLTKQLKTRIKKKDDEINNLKIEKNVCNTSLEALKVELRKKDSLVKEEAKKEKNELQAELTKKEKEKEELRKELTSAEKEKDELRRELTFAENEKEELRTELTLSGQKEVNELTDEITQLKNKLEQKENQLKAQVEKLQKKIRIAEKAKTKAKKK
jgi:chromosome segregation ATPase